MFVVVWCGFARNKAATWQAAKPNMWSTDAVGHGLCGRLSTGWLTDWVYILVDYIVGSLEGRSCHLDSYQAGFRCALLLQAGQLCSWSTGGRMRLLPCWLSGHAQMYK